MSSHSQRSRNDRLVIGIAGRIGAGKTTAAEFLATAHGFHYLRYSQVLAELAHGAKGKEALQQLGWDVMSHGRQRELNARLIRKIRDRGDYVVDGLRHPIDFQSLKKKFDDKFLLVYITSSINRRFARVKHRRHLTTLANFRKVDRHPVECHIVSLKSKAFAVVRNASTKATLRRSLDRLVGKVRKGGRV
jgi:dephospho-CoA kinase